MRFLNRFLNRFSFNWWQSCTTMVVTSVIAGYFLDPVFTMVLALIASAIASYFDKGVTQFRRDVEGIRLKHYFASSTEALAGYILKDLDVPLAEVERITRSVTQHIKTRSSTFWIEAGQRNSYALFMAVRNFNKHCHHHSSLVRTLCSVLLEASDWGLTHAATSSQSVAVKTRLREIQLTLDLPHAFFEEVERQKPQNQDALPLNTTRAANILGVMSTASIKEIKIAYKRKVQDIHPDRLIAKGVSEEELRLASDEMDRLRKAYEFLRQRNK